MSEEQMGKLEMLFQSIEQHTVFVKNRMAEAGLPPDENMARLVAKYFEAFEKLAAE